MCNYYSNSRFDSNELVSETVSARGFECRCASDLVWNSEECDCYLGYLYFILNLQLKLCVEV